jgi:uncharacterized protein involved in exopolysaccharide biosynthesis
MEEKKISNVTDEFDIRLFLRVARKNIAWIVLFFIIAFLMGFLYLRYTYPIYESKSVIQIAKPQNNAQSILKKSSSETFNLPGKIELLKSPVFLNRIFQKLPLDISYYQIGNVLNYEMYRSSPFEVEYRNSINELFNIPVYVLFTDENNVTLSVNINNKDKVYKLKTGVWLRNPIIDSVRVNVKNYNKIRKDMGGQKDRPYYFILNKREFLYRNYSPNLTIETESAEAGTIKIINHDRNAAKATDICNTIAEEFREYDIERQSESANNTIKFVNEQLKTMYDKLYDSEVNLQNFKNKYGLDSTIKLPDFNSRIIDLEKKLSELELEESSLRTVEEAISADREMDIYKLVSLIAGVKTEGMSASLLKDLQQQMSTREALLYSKTQNSAEVARLDFQINIKRKLIIETLLVQKKNIYAQKQDIENRINAYEQEIIQSALSFDRLELLSLTKLSQVSESYYNRLVDIKSELTISNAGITSENTVLETSTTPASPYFPSKRIVTLSAFIGWIIISLGLIIMRYLFHNEITSQNEIMKYLQVPMLGIVPNYRDVIPISQLLVDKKPKSIIAESLRSIRSNLEFLSTKEGPKVLAITSTISGENIRCTKPGRNYCFFRKESDHTGSGYAETKNSCWVRCT